MVSGRWHAISAILWGMTHLIHTDDLQGIAPMPIDTTHFRHVLSNFATGVTVVGARFTPSDTSAKGPKAQTQLVGFTANAFCSVSLDPPLVLVCIGRQNMSHDTITQSGAFSINMLDASQEAVARGFAVSGPAKYDMFKRLAHHPGVTGSPILDDALGWIECKLVAAYPGGDHDIIVGEVLALADRPGTPLLYYQGKYTAPQE